MVAMPLYRYRPRKNTKCIPEFINYEFEVDANGEVMSKLPDKDNHTVDSVRFMPCHHYLTEGERKSSVSRGKENNPRISAKNMAGHASTVQYPNDED